MEGNLTRGPILKTLTKLAIPIMASSFLGTLYNITDMAWIGLLGAKAVAGVGVGGMFTWLSQGLASMARMGGQVQVAQCIGRGERQKAHGFAQTAMQLALLMGLAYGIIVALFANPLVGFFRLEDAETLRAALDYTRIACGCIVFSFLSVTLTGIYTAQGDSKTPFVANLFGLAANMILDPVLILGPGPFPRFGAAGAAIATVLAQVIVTGIMLLGIFVQKKDNVLKGLRLFVKIPLEYVEGICEITGNEGIRTMQQAEPIGPNNFLDIMVIAPCTGNSAAKIANGITDTPVLMASKAHMRNGKPLVIAISTNDALGVNFKTIGMLMNMKNIYFVPFGQDNYKSKPNSMIARMELLPDTIEAAMRGKQIQPIVVAES
mgnify:CR=1 FL=1